MVEAVASNESLVRKARLNYNYLTEKVTRAEKQGDDVKLTITALDDTPIRIVTVKSPKKGYGYLSHHPAEVNGEHFIEVWFSPEE